MNGVRCKGVDADRVLRADGERLAKRGLDRGVAYGHGRDRSAQLLIELKSAGKAKLIVGINHKLHPIGIQRASVCRELNFSRSIGNVADANENLHT